MSDTLFNWLNNEIKLSQEIKAFESDFSNGYLFGELLHIHHSIDNFHLFKNDSESLSIFNNFSYLRPALEKLSINLNEEKINLLINHQRGEAAILLYKIKTNLTRKKIKWNNIMTTHPNTLNYPKPALTEGNQSTLQENKPKGIVSGRKIQLEPLKFTANMTQQFTKRHRSKIALNEIQEEESSSHRKNTTTIMLKSQSVTAQPFNKTNSKVVNVTALNWKKDDDQNKYCELETLDDNLHRLGIELKSIDPKIRKYCVGEKINFIPTEIVMKKINDKVQLEQHRIKQEKESKRFYTEYEKMLKRSVLKGCKIDEKKSDVLKTKNDKQVEYENYRKTHFSYRSRQDTCIQNTLNSFNTFYKTTTTRGNEKGFDSDIFFRALHKDTLPKRLQAINKKYTIREENMPYIEKIMNTIIELTDEAFDYQQSKQRDLVDLPGWKEWMTLFVEGKPCKKQITKVKGYILTEEDLKAPLIEIETEIPFDIPEYLDYITMIGQWSSKLIIPNKDLGKELGLFDILDNDIAFLLSGGKFLIQGIKPSQLKIMPNDDFEPRQEDIDNITVPSTLMKNVSFGEIIEYSIEIKSTDNTISTPSHSGITYNHIPIKLCMIGHMFSGRKTISKLLHEKYQGIKVYVIYQIIQEGIDLYEKLHSPIESLPKFKQMKKNQIEQIQKDRAAEIENNKIILDIVEPLVKKELQSLSDNTLIDILLTAIQKDFPYKDEKIIIEEITNRNQRKTQIEEELEKLRSEPQKKGKAKAKEKEEHLLISELDKLNNSSYIGFICADFPKTYDQFVLLEKRTTGFLQEIDKDPSNKDILLNELMMGIDKSSCNRTTSLLAKSFFNNFICLNVNEIETLRRSTGRIIDPNTKIIYHREDFPPPDNDKKLKERLVNITEPSESDIRILVETYDINYNQIMDFLALFHNNKILPLNTSKEIAIEMIQDTMTNIIKTYENYEERDLMNEINVNTNILLYENSDNNPSWRFLQRLSEVKKRLSTSMITQIFNEWTIFNTSYSKSLNNTFAEMNNQKDRIIEQMNLIQKGFTDFLNRKSCKKDLVQIFMNKYNTFSEKYYSWKFTDLLKEEYARDLSVLTDYFWEIIDTRKTEAINERDLIMKNGFIEKQMDVFYSNLEKMFLVETDKFLLSIDIIRKFFLGFELLPSNDINPFFVDITSRQVTKELENYNLIEQIPVISKDKPNTQNALSSPKIERLYKNCIKLLFQYDYKMKEIEANIKALLSLNNSSDINSNITHRKKKTLTTKGEYSIANSDIFNQEEELKTALKLEKNKYKYRVTMLKYFGMNYLKEIKTISQSTFNTLDEWIVQSIKMQNEVMNDLVSHFGSIINDKITDFPSDMELDNFNVFTPKHFFFGNNKLFQDSYQKGKTINKDDYDFDSLKKIINECRASVLQSNFIVENILMDLFFRKHAIELQSSGISLLIKEMSFKNYYAFIRKFDIGNPKRKIVWLNDFFTIIVILKYKIITEAEKETLINSVNSKLKNRFYLNKEDFKGIHMWFENDNDTSDSECKLTKKIKELLFEINKTSNNEINFIDLLSVVSFKTLNQTEMKGQTFKNYKDLFTSA